MGRFVDGADRSQLTLLPECLDDWVGEDNAVHVIDAFVEALDLHGMGFERVIAKETGRPSYHPAVLLKLYIYGYPNRVQSSRRLEHEACRNIEVMWLIGRLAPDHKTIADFRKDNGAAIQKVLCEVHCTMPANGPVADPKRRDRRQQVQGGEQSRPQLHACQDGEADGADRGKRRSISA